MKFFHLSDLHIGKQLHHYNLREDQEHILAEVLSYAASIHPDAIEGLITQTSISLLLFIGTTL